MRVECEVFFLIKALSAKTRENLIQKSNLVFFGTISIITLTETREKRNVILNFRERFDVITSTEI